MKAAHLFILALAALTAAASAAPQKIKFTPACPQHAERACLVMSVGTLQRPTKRAIWRKARANEPLFVRGRIGGGEAQVFRVIRAGEAWESMSVAYFGRTAENRPIFLTDRGPIEVEAPYFDADEQLGLVVVERRGKHIIDRYLRIADGEYVVNSAHDVAVWDVARKVCIAAPRRRPGELVVAKGKCKAWDSLGPGLTLERRISGNVEYPVEDDVPDRLYTTVFTSRGMTMRIRGSHELLAQPDVPVDECGDEVAAPIAFERLDAALDWMRVRE